MFEQIGIALTGTIAVWLTQDQRENWRRYACIFGLIGQPFWFYSAWKAGQIGVFIVCILYTFSWLRGINNHWIKRDTKCQK